MTSIDSRPARPSPEQPHPIHEDLRDMTKHPPTNRWQNWAENVSAEPTLLLAPQSKEEIIQLIQMARAEHRKVRVAGSGHSWSPLVPTRDVLMQMHHFN